MGFTMLKKILSSGKAKFIMPLMILTILLLGLFVFFNYTSSKRYKEQFIVAETYLEEGKYEKAIDAYKKAILMKKSKPDHEKLTIGLAEAYSGLNNYDEALQTLREFYIKSDSLEIKQKIEEIIYLKTEYEFEQALSRGDRFFSNEEYNKAIAEYEKAKKVNSRDATSYEKIAESYIAMGEYDDAYNEIINGLALTQDESLNQILSRIEHKQDLVQYNKYIEEANEYIYQEHFTEAIEKYQEAIKLIPEKETAYIKLGETYITLGRYDRAIASAEGALELIDSGGIEEVINKASSLKEKVDKRKGFLLDLYNATNYLDISEIEKLMRDKYFQENIVQDEPVYYSQLGEGLISTGSILIIYDDKSIYSGGIKKGMRTGMGVYFMLSDSNKDKGIYYYEGEWKDDLPNGNGKTVVKNNISGDNSEGLEEILTTGNYKNGLEHGWFNKRFYYNEKEKESVYYRAKDGIPTPIKGEDGKTLKEEETGKYAVGEIYIKDVATGKYYYVDQGVVWGVQPYVR